jgi:type IV fimbrial biogenesis protein FimT
MKPMRGITLIELLVTLTITAILITLAGPSFVRLLRSNSMAGAVNGFMADNRYARSEAVRRGSRVVMCRSAAPENAEPACAAIADPGGRGWATGWIVFQDSNNDGEFSVAGQDVLLRVTAAQTSLDVISDGSAGTPKKFIFTANGRLLSVTDNARMEFGGVSYDTNLKRVVCVSGGGRTRIAGNGDAECAEIDES